MMDYEEANKRAQQALDIFMDPNKCKEVQLIMWGQYAAFSEVAKG